MRTREEVLDESIRRATDMLASFETLAAAFARARAAAEQLRVVLEELDHIEEVGTTREVPEGRREDS